MLSVLPRVGLLFMWVLLVSGCTVLNTFHSPKALRPGEVVVGLGGTLPPRPEPDTDFYIPFSQPELFLRAALIPRLELGVKTAGFRAYGAGAKVQILRAPLLLAINAGAGAGQDGGSPVNDSFKARTRYAGLLAGYELKGPSSAVLYGGAKLTDYFYRATYPGDFGPPTSETYEGAVPGITLGFAVTGDRERMWPIIEANTYFLPEGRVTTLGAALQIRLFRRR